MDRREIMRHLPHQGRMCLLQSLIDQDAESIHCMGLAPDAPDHPLAGPPGFGTINLVEYAAQAAALHSVLAGGQTSGEAAAGMLVALRNVCIADLPKGMPAGPPDVHARRLLQSVAGLIYEFELRVAEQCLVSGRLTVLLGSPGRAA